MCDDLNVGNEMRFTKKRFSQFILRNFYNVALHFSQTDTETGTPLNPPCPPLTHRWQPLLFSARCTTLKKRIDMLEKPGKSNKGIGLDWIEAKGIAFCASFGGGGVG